MNNLERIGIAKEFVSHHKEHDPREWAKSWQGKFQLDNEVYLELFRKLEDGEYGECRDDIEYDDEGLIVSGRITYEVEIAANESKTGASVLFQWQEDCGDINLIKRNDNSIVVCYLGRNYKLSTHIGQDGDLELTHYNGYCAETSDLISDFNGNDALENDLRRITTCCGER